MLSLSALSVLVVKCCTPLAFGLSPPTKTHDYPIELIPGMSPPSSMVSIAPPPVET